MNLRIENISVANSNIDLSVDPLPDRNRDTTEKVPFLANIARFGHGYKMVGQFCLASQKKLNRFHSNTKFQ